MLSTRISSRARFTRLAALMVPDSETAIAKHCRIHSVPCLPITAVVSCSAEWYRGETHLVCCTTAALKLSGALRPLRAPVFRHADLRGALRPLRAPVFGLVTFTRDTDSWNRCATIFGRVAVGRHRAKARCRNDYY